MPTNVATPPHASGLLARVQLKWGVTQAQFADLLGVSPRSVASWKAGDQEPNEATIRKLKELERLADALAGVMKGESIARWLAEPAPAFEPLSPLEVIKRGQVDRIWQMIFLLESGAPT